MLSLGSTYLIVKDFEESIKFYESLLEMKVTSQNFNRWAQFNFGDSCIALFNPKYDEERLTRETDIPNVYSREYLKVKKNKVIKYGNNFVLNLGFKSQVQQNYAQRIPHKGS